MSKAIEAFTVTSHFEGKAPVVFQIYKQLLKSLRRYGPVIEDPKKTSIHLVNATAAAFVRTSRVKSCGLETLFPSTAVMTSPASTPARAAPEFESTDATSTPSLSFTPKNPRNCGVSESARIPACVMLTEVITWNDWNPSNVCGSRKTSKLGVWICNGPIANGDFSDVTFKVCS